MNLKKKLKNVIFHIKTSSYFIVRLQLAQTNKDFNKTEDHLKALQSVGQIIGEVLKQVDTNKCSLFYNHLITL